MVRRFGTFYVEYNFNLQCCNKIFLDVVVLYVISAVYFAGVMVRLMLTLTPVVCVLSGIAFSLIFDCHMKEEETTIREIEEENERRKLSVDKVGGF